MAGLRGPVFVGSEIYRGSSYGLGHPLRVPRVSTVMDLTRALGWRPPERSVNSPRAKPAALIRWHDADYIAALQRAEARQWVSAAHRARYHLGTPSNPVFAEMYRRPATAAGGAMLAAEMLKDGSVVYSPASGTHHGLPGRANGFCYLNDPVLAILRLRDMGLRRIAYVDIDAHHPDGVEHAFAGDADMLMISVHEERRWPFTGMLEDAGVGNLFNLPVPRGFNDTEMAAVLDRLIGPAVEGFAPQAVVLQCGADALDEDPLSRLSLSNNSLWAVVAALQALAPRYLVLGGGGYDPWAVGRAWTGVWGVLMGAPIPARLPAAGEAVLRGLRGWARRGRAPTEAMMTTLRDPPREGPLRDVVRARIDTLARRL